MITYKPIIIPGGRRKDGTWPVKIRVTFKGVSRRVPTTLTCTDADLTRSKRIKNATILQKAGELIAQMRATCDDLSPFTLEAWTVDQVLDHIREGMLGETFRLDFIAFGREFIRRKDEGTRAGYTTALNAFARFLGRESIDINDITRALLISFQEWADTQPRMFYNYRKGTYQPTAASTVPGGNSGRWLQRLAHIHKAAKERYNDEDSGRILIPRSPFDNIPKPKVFSEGEECLPVEVIQRVIDARPEKPQMRIALAAFVVSFGMMGMNLADMFEGIPVKPGQWQYNRRKTRKKRQDRAKVIVRVEPELAPFLDILNEPPGLHWWKSFRVADTMVNKYLREWCEAEGIEPFKFYAGRHSFATLARRHGIELATVDEALGHKGKFPIADIYAERNWALSWEATRKVLDQFSWTTSDNIRTKSAVTDEQPLVPGDAPGGDCPSQG